MKMDSTYSNAQHTKNREYVKVGKMNILPNDVRKQRKLSTNIWKNLVFNHLLSFYKNCNIIEIQRIIQKEKEKKSKPENGIAIYLRNYLSKCPKFNIHGFRVVGGKCNDKEIFGIYDISIEHSYWVNEEFLPVSFDFECKNLDSSQDLINKYVNYNTYEKDSNGNCKFDGGVLRYFNGKYAQDQDFGGMIGFVLKGDLSEQKNKILLKLKDKFNTSPDGDLIEPIMDNSIEGNHFTFDSIHNRNNKVFILHHLLFDFS